jgi:hypothetical protein
MVLISFSVVHTPHGQLEIVTGLANQGAGSAATSAGPITCGAFNVGVTVDTQEPTLQGLDKAYR